jgi:hypothetical protein
MSPYVDETVTRERIAELHRRAEQWRLTSSVARGWLPPIDFHLRFELRLSTRKPAHASHR